MNNDWRSADIFNTIATYTTIKQIEISTIEREFPIHKMLNNMFLLSSIKPNIKHKRKITRELRVDINLEKSVYAHKIFIVH